MKQTNELGKFRFVRMILVVCAALAAQVAFVMITASRASAEPRTCQLVQELAWELGCNSGGSTYGAPPGATIDNTHDFVMNNNFGPTQCKTEALAKDATKEFKTECNQWLKDRKGELSNKFNTGTCNEDCTDCSAGLKKCMVRGVIHYTR